MKNNNYNFKARVYSRIMLTLILIPVMLLSTLGDVFAQNTVTIGNGTSSNYRYGPYYRSSSGSSYAYSRYAYVYTSGELNIPPGAIITKVEWHKRNGTISGNNTFKIFMDNTTSSSLSSGTTWGSLNSGTTTVYSSTTQSFTNTGWIPFTLTAPFEYTGNNLLIMTDHKKSGSASGSNNFYYTTATGKAIGYARNTVLNNSTQLTTSYGNRRPNIRITWEPGCSGDVLAEPTDVVNACSNDDIMFKATFDSVQKYQWQVNSGNGWTNIGNDAIYSGTNTNQLVVKNINPPFDQYQYRVIGTNTFENCSVKSDSADVSLILSTPSSIQVSAGPDSNICENQTVTMHSAFTNGGNKPGYKWTLNGLAIPGATQPTLTINNLDHGDIVQCHFTSSTQCVYPSTSNPIKFHVTQNTSASVQINSIYNGGNSYSFIADPKNGGAKPEFYWYVNGKLLPNQNKKVLTTDKLSSFDKVHVEMLSSIECAEPRLSSSSLKTTAVVDAEVDDIVLQLAPNPNTGRFTISGNIKQAGQSTAQKNLDVNITNTLGQSVYKQSFTLDKMLIKIPVSMDSGIPNGVYMVNIAVGDKLYHKRFIVSR